MDRIFEPVIRSLIPAHNGDIPPELVQLARSLLTQSRAIANLKPDEEVARNYVCAHLACERLKQPLNLPQITPRPPVPPRTYKKLHSFFDSALPARTVQRNDEPRTPSKRNRGELTTTPKKNRTPSKVTPKPTPSKKATQDRVDVADDDGLPAWVLPAIRKLAKNFEAPPAVPHVYAGMSSIVKLLQSGDEKPSHSRTSRTRTRGAAVAEIGVEQAPFDLARLPALLISLFLFVNTKLSGQELTEEDFTAYKTAAIRTLVDLGKTGGRKPEEISIDIDGLLGQAKDEWLGMEWFENVPQGEGRAHEDENDVVMDDESEVDELNPHSRGWKRETRNAGQSDMPQGGLGTMMQEKIDYCSEENRRDFLRWKKGIMMRIQQMEKEEADREVMDTSA